MPQHVRAFHTAEYLVTSFILAMPIPEGRKGLSNRNTFGLINCLLGISPAPEY